MVQTSDRSISRQGIDMHIMNEAVRASLQSQLLSCFVTGSQLRPGSLLSSENQSLGYLPADKDRHAVGVAEEEIA